MTFGPGSTYGPEGRAPRALYMVLTWLGIAFMVVALIAWMVYENRRLIAYSLGDGRGLRPSGRTRSPGSRRSRGVEAA